MDISILYKMSYGVYILSVMDGDRPTGCVANSAMQITVEPPTVAVSISKNNFSNECIRKAKKFSLSILHESCDPSIIGNFGFSSGKDVDKFEGIEYEMIDGVPVVKDSIGAIVLELRDSMETSTHTVFLGEMVDGVIFNKEEPMTYAYYHNVLKGKTAKNAPTYRGEDENEEVQVSKKKHAFKCKVCGYIEETDFDELPEDYKCPICKKDRTFFEKLY